MKKKKKGLIITLVVIAVLVVLYIIGTLTGATHKEEEQPSASPESAAPSQEALEPSVQISAPDLVAAYQENEVSADAEYKDKVVEVTGFVGSVGKDVIDDVYVTVNDGGEYTIISVQCYFEDEAQIAKTAELSEGDEVSIIGTCDGQAGVNVILRDCIIK